MRLTVSAAYDTTVRGGTRKGFLVNYCSAEHPMSIFLLLIRFEPCSKHKGLIGNVENKMHRDAFYFEAQKSPRLAGACGGGWIKASS